MHIVFEIVRDGLAIVGAITLAVFGVSALVAKLGRDGQIP